MKFRFSVYVTSSQSEDQVFSVCHFMSVRISDLQFMSFQANMKFRFSVYVTSNQSEDQIFSFCHLKPIRRSDFQFMSLKAKTKFRYLVCHFKPIWDQNSSLSLQAIQKFRFLVYVTQSQLDFQIFSLLLLANLTEEITFDIITVYFAANALKRKILWSICEYYFTRIIRGNYFNRLKETSFMLYHWIKLIKTMQTVPPDNTQSSDWICMFSFKIE